MTRVRIGLAFVVLAGALAYLGLGSAGGSPVVLASLRGLMLLGMPLVLALTVRERCHA